MRNGDDLLYTLTPIFSEKLNRNIGPFVDRSSSNRDYG